MPDINDAALARAVEELTPAARPGKLIGGRMMLEEEERNLACCGLLHGYDDPQRTDESSFTLPVDPGDAVVAKLRWLGVGAGRRAVGSPVEIGMVPDHGADHRGPARATDPALAP